MNHPLPRSACKRVDILRSAAAEFRRRGYHGASVDQIASALNMTKGNLGMSAGVFVRRDPKLLTFAIMSAMNWVPLWYKPSGGASPEDIAQMFADYLVAGLLARPAKASRRAASVMVSPRQRRERDLDSVECPHFVRGS